MMKLRIIVILFLLYLLAFISLNYSLNLLSPYYYIKDLIIYPVLASVNHQELNLSLEMQNNLLESKSKEIAELKKLLAMKNVLTEFNYLNATIIMRNREYWFNTITIDKGKKDGIKENMAVVTRNGLIGKINSVSDTSSEVKWITSDDLNFKVSIAIKTNEVDNYAILNGYDNKTKLIKATGIDKTTNINIGDSVLTSGLGEFFPAGIYIGTVEKIESDKYNLSKTVYIKTNQNYSDIHYVTVLKAKKW